MSGAGQQLYARAKARIPGGTQLLSKRPEMALPEQWPAYFSKARGVDVWDLDGRRYIDMSHNAVGSCVLGVGDPDVDRAVRSAIEQGSMCTLNCPEEVELADLLCELHPWAAKVRYARGGGEAMALAVRIARACTGREQVAFSGYHGWHDWYLAANLGEQDALDGHLLPGLDPAGVPRSLRGTAHTFSFQRLDELEALVADRGDQLAAIVMEPLRYEPPPPGFLQGVRQIATRHGAVLIFDEITIGWRLNTGGVHLLHDVTPDVAVFAKAMSNGYPMAAVIGVGAVMDAAQKSFISSTYWTERIGPAAALAMIRKHRACDVPRHLNAIGERVQTGWRKAADRTGLLIHVRGLAPLSRFAFDSPDHQALRTLFTQEMLHRGFLATEAFNATYAHTNAHVDEYLVATGETFALLADAARKDRVEALLKGPVAHSGFRRLT